MKNNLKKSSSEKNYSRTQKAVIRWMFGISVFIILAGLIVMAIGRDYAVRQESLRTQDQQAAAKLEDDPGTHQTSAAATSDAGNSAAFYALLATSILSFLACIVLTIANNLNRQKSNHYLKDEAAHRKRVEHWLAAWKKIARQRDAVVAEWIHKEEEISASLGKDLFSHRYGFEVSGTGSRLPNDITDMSGVERLLPRYAPHLVGDNPPSIENLDFDYKTAALADATTPEATQHSTTTTEGIHHE